MKRLLCSNCRGTAALICAATLIYALSGCSSVPINEFDPLEAVASIDPPMAFEGTDFVPSLSPEPEDDPYFIQDPYTPAHVRVKGVYLRKGPYSRARSLGKISRGQELKVYHIRKDGWCEVETPKGVTGYVWAPLLDIEGRKFKTARYKGMTHILVSSKYYLGPDGKKRSRLEVRGLKLRAPLESTRLTSRFGIRKKHPVNGGRNKMHQGVDLKAEIGTPVRAAANGIVKRVRKGPNYGIYVDISHKLGITTRYAHLDEALVIKGQRVSAGAIIARSGNTGATTGPHLHFELHKRGRAIRPAGHVPGLY